MGNKQSLDNAEVQESEFTTVLFFSLPWCATLFLSPLVLSLVPVAQSAEISPKRVKE